MKNWFSKKGNILTLALLGFVLWKQLPLVVGNFKMEGREIQSKEYSPLNAAGTLATFPPLSGKTIAIFWATWCGPCKLEMERLTQSVKENKIPQGAIFAINPFEEANDTIEFIRKNNYPFTFIHAPEVASELNVLATPTTVFIDERKIDSISSGLSFIGIWRAESYL